MITFRTAQKKDAEACVDLLTESFLTYEYFHIFAKTPETQKKFIKTVLTIELHVALKKSIVLVAEDSQKIIAVALLEKPDYKDPSLLEYILAGGLNLIRVGGLKNALEFLDMFHQTNNACKQFKKTTPSCWHLSSLAVADTCKGQGIGSRMLLEGIFPYVRQNNGKTLTLITNTHKNCQFYKKNGFKEFKYELLLFNNISLANWSFKISL